MRLQGMVSGQETGVPEGLRIDKRWSAGAPPAGSIARGLRSAVHFTLRTASTVVCRIGKDPVRLLPFGLKPILQGLAFPSEKAPASSPVSRRILRLLGTTPLPFFGAVLLRFLVSRTVVGVAAVTAERGLSGDRVVVAGGKTGDVVELRELPSGAILKCLGNGRKGSIPVSVTGCAVNQVRSAGLDGASASGFLPAKAQALEHSYSSKSTTSP